jgi:hypothetical protein
MRDNPLHVAAYGADPERPRRRSIERTFSTLFRVFGAQSLSALSTEVGSSP